VEPGVSDRNTQVLVIRRATQHDMPALLDFVGRTYGAGAPFKDIARHRWQFEENPFRPAHETDPTIWIALDGARVIGEIAVQDGALWLEGDRIPAGWIVDVMVDPAYRGRGLGHRIHQAVMAERPVLVTLTMAPATRRMAERAGCLTLGPTRQFILPHRVSVGTVKRFLHYKAQTGSVRRAAVLRAFNASILGPMGVAGCMRMVTGLRRWWHAPRRPVGLRVSEVDRFPADMDALWADVRDGFTAVFERSAAFLNWRFVDAPGLTYRRFLLEREGKLVGYLVTRRGVAQELPLGVIVDVFADPTDTEALTALVAKACDLLCPEVEYLEAAASMSTCGAVLRSMGFFAPRIMRPTVVCSDDRVRARLEKHPDDWHFTKADHDWDQIHPV
jgi:GNAT superfamily N-acetyltransferase